MIRLPVRPTAERPVPQDEEHVLQPESQGKGGPDPTTVPVAPEPEPTEVPAREKSAVSAPTELNRPEPSLSTPWEASLAQITQSFQQSLQQTLESQRVENEEFRREMREELKRESEAREASQRVMHQEMTQAILESSKNQFEALRMTLEAIKVAPVPTPAPIQQRIPAQPIQAIEPQQPEEAQKPTDGEEESSKKKDEEK